MIRVVAAVIVAEFPDGVSRVLAGRRLEPPSLAGLWEFPGGKVEPHESDSAALRREIREELGVELTSAAPLGDALPMTGIAEGMWQPYLATTAQQPQLIDHAEFRWLAADELHSVPWLTTDVPVLARVAAALDPAAAGAAG